MIDQSLMNDVKGEFFEFLVGRKLAQLFQVEKDFYFSMGVKKLSHLIGQEKYIRECDVSLIEKFTILANKTSEVIEKKILNLLLFLNERSMGKRIKIERVMLLGDEYREEKDLGLILTNEKQYYISLKLCKNQSFVNTKSAGISSFLSTYFFSDITLEIENEFKEKCYFAHNMLANNLNDQHALESTDQFDHYKKENYPTLPGQLKGKFQNYLFKYYGECSMALFHSLDKIRKNRFPCFQRGLGKIMGLGNPQTLQVICFHSGTLDYDLKKILCDYYSDKSSFLRNVKMLSPKVNQTSFGILMSKKQLQIRIKPMREFTESSPKINCSVKWENEF